MTTSKLGSDPFSTEHFDEPRDICRRMRDEVTEQYNVNVLSRRIGMGRRRA